LLYTLNIWGRAGGQVQFCPKLPLLLGIGRNWTEKIWTKLAIIGQKLGKIGIISYFTDSFFGQKKAGQDWT
jgi:hypothetical protein